jgi:hypothetical protein
MRVARRILVDGDQARHAAALLVFAAHRVARALRRDHHDVDRSLRLDQAEMDVEAVGEGDRRAVADVAGDVVLVDVGLQFVRGRHHHQVGPCGGFGHGHDLEAVGLRPSWPWPNLRAGRRRHFLRPNPSGSAHAPGPASRSR